MALRTTRLWLGIGLLCACGGRAGDETRDSSDALPVQGQPATSTKPATPATPPPAAATAPNAFIQPTSPPPSEPHPTPQPPSPTPSSPATEPSRPNPAPAPASDACFEYLGDWITCENSGWPNVEKTDATDLAGCMQLCSKRADCTAVTDYFWMDRPDLGCWLYTSTCNAPAGGVWQEEDGGRQYRKRCDTP